MFAQSGHSHKKVRFGTAGDNARTGEVSEEADDPEAILEGLGADVHLIGAKIDAGVNFMLAANQVEIVLEGVDVGTTLKRGVAAIAERPITALTIAETGLDCINRQRSGTRRMSSQDPRREFPAWPHRT